MLMKIGEQLKSKRQEILAIAPSMVPVTFGSSAPWSEEKPDLKAIWISL